MVLSCLLWYIHQGSALYWCFRDKTCYIQEIHNTRCTICFNCSRKTSFAANFPFRSLWMQNQAADVGSRSIDWIEYFWNIWTHSTSGQNTQSVGGNLHILLISILTKGSGLPLQKGLFGVQVDFTQLIGAGQREKYKKIVVVNFKLDLLWERKYS